MANKENITVKFLVPVTHYRVDDVATFPTIQANRIIEQGYGIEVTLESTKIKEDK